MSYSGNSADDDAATEFDNDNFYDATSTLPVELAVFLVD